MLWAGLKLAVTLLTVIPLPGRAAVPTRRAGAAAMAWAPAVGLVAGGIAAGIVWLLGRPLQAGPLLAAVLAIAMLAAVSGGLHLDGLADLADGLASRASAARSLEIMKRPDIGPYGVLALVFVVLLQVSALARAEELGRGAIAVVAAAVTARLSMTWACRRSVPAARDTGLGALVAGTLPPAVPLAIAAAVLTGAAAAGWIFAAAVAAGLAAGDLTGRLAVRRIRGITGDVLGAMGEIAAATCLLVTALR